jgi:FtsH-binding integral membrane protein
MDLLKTTGAKVASGAVTLGVIAAGIAWWQADPATRQAVEDRTLELFAWFGVVLLLPFASFFVIGAVAKLDHNGAGAALVASYTALELGLMAWLFHAAIHSPVAWTLAVVGGLIAAVYNLLACDWIADKLER